MSDVRTQSDEAAELNAGTPLVKALLGGTKAMHAAGSKYMPRQPREDQEDWQYRLDTATLYPAFERTVEVLAAKPFSKPLKPADDTPARMKPWVDSIDVVGKKGRNLHTFASAICQDAIAYGFCGILVDYPKVQNIRTKADEIASGARPYFVHVRSESILGWLPADAQSVEELTQLRLLESASVADGEFNSKCIEQVRVLGRGTWQVWRKAETGNKEWAVHDEGTTTISTIPFVPVYGKRKGFMCATPPMMPLAEQNKDHWRESSDQRDSVRFCRKRMLVFIGAEPEGEVTAASNYFVKLPQGSDAKILQGSAEAVKIGRDEINTIEEQMRQSGSEMLVIRPGKVTATQTTSENQGNLCALQQIAFDLDDSLNTALQLMAEWVGESQGGHVAVFKDFGAATLAEASADLLLKATLAGEMSKESLHEELQRRGIRSGEITWEEEKKRIEADRELDGMPQFSVPMPGAPAPTPSPTPAAAAE
ncbi:DUF4055 domain-containing protein [Duganella violaceipulchra]|uniref:DUF4055 domain-containing protein n=1 Tax=Duganella violaceipulchra TaxID=2849652 RepID=A0AA41L269_9BURK|nr:DUF4055 domain-containing protein [Duganella violaceicalia]MBV6321913.1 DUF4055 domain-containing protein [Duganella violaceicalia]MCP2007093.1 hypothetical protein [Duganella violaceicalia]